MVRHQHKLQKAVVGDHNYENLFESDSSKKPRPKKNYALRTKLYHIRKLIKAKDYSQARYELLGIDHPKAEEWIEKINQRDPNYYEKTIIPIGSILIMLIMMCTSIGIVIGLSMR